MSVAIILKSSLNFMETFLSICLGITIFWLCSWASTSRGLGKEQEMSVKMLGVRDSA